MFILRSMCYTPTEVAAMLKIEDGALGVIKLCKKYDPKGLYRLGPQQMNGLAVWRLTAVVHKAISYLTPEKLEKATAIGLMGVISSALDKIGELRVSMQEGKSSRKVSKLQASIEEHLNAPDETTEAK